MARGNGQEKGGQEGQQPARTEKALASAHQIGPPSLGQSIGCGCSHCGVDEAGDTLPCSRSGTPERSGQRNQHWCGEDPSRFSRPIFVCSYYYPTNVTLFPLAAAQEPRGMSNGADGR